mmetsp:Transcript_22833/g.65891  ORF Transcript_22833/g.65891 Transcript_22833/m.65891 type:complete len:172 (-) Transcript_22833:122-637(-)|eukprot:CAMPEP_0170237240 /NCGR_PEP_ID=MMETSP0116_2-20130129/18370_1 /TAXON_ID=400756 /ORGANISM="Durinskia baltica, Strain CSIRO CS-38" /LENGTH=171 /DNA_ID=CAMNT_0010488043 /DNA_START=133 /DNA_END=648 /DNA_ORIENTATION=+
MKPDWDRLMAEFQGHPSTLVVDVDCVGDGRPLCKDFGVRSYPTIKYGDPKDLQDYKGARGYAGLKAFADSLAPAAPVCGPAHLDRCGEAQRKLIQDFIALGAHGRGERIRHIEAQLKSSEDEYKAFVKGLQVEYTELEAEKDKAIQAVKDSGLPLLKSVHAYQAQVARGEL